MAFNGIKNLVLCNWGAQCNLIHYSPAPVKFTIYLSCTDVLVHVGVILAPALTAFTTILDLSYTHWHNGPRATHRLTVYHAVP